MKSKRPPRRKAPCPASATSAAAITTTPATRDMTRREDCDMTKRKQTYADLIPKVGKCYMFRTLSDHYVGRVTAVGNRCVALEDAAWIADSGRLEEFVRTGRADGLEVEPVDDATVYYEVFIAWDHAPFTQPIPARRTS